ncbi:hypothetical protein PAAG_00041 [Paracoccidioides lutzii Pb01]|uniref:Uncharacterized protein n=1 Tax=Paracoccidioides lutzii (strain ATCC MYA-826 / Pb01) TaxID=502779 RepID=C1GNE6_PARBA|nr:hypothetical protein PAAG_00041 [Paracoccidioides lutzii Pb01]EEH35718.2 hypothetical protein PAAG_00041 [Paracoccidioides lutzii Pb01]
MGDRDPRFFPSGQRRAFLANLAVITCIVPGSPNLLEFVDPTMDGAVEAYSFTLTLLTSFQAPIVSSATFHLKIGTFIIQEERQRQRFSIYAAGFNLLDFWKHSLKAVNCLTVFLPDFTVTPTVPVGSYRSISSRTIDSTAKDQFFVQGDGKLQANRDHRIHLLSTGNTPPKYHFLKYIFEQPSLVWHNIFKFTSQSPRSSVGAQQRDPKTGASGILALQSDPSNQKNDSSAAPNHAI